VGLVNRGISAIAKLLLMGAVVLAFLLGMVGVVVMSLRGAEVKVPEIVGKTYPESERELTELGLKIKRRAERSSSDPPNTVLEQLPRPGETVKTGQLILVVTSRQSTQAEETPSTLKRSIEEDDSEKIEEMISDKPKRRSNSNTNKKKADTTRDVMGNTATSTTNSSVTTGEDSNKKEPAANKSPDSKPPDTKPPAPVIKPTPGRPAGTDRQRGQIRPAETSNR
jgi:beta-lactam-binding protein with PASTA domain